MTDTPEPAKPSADDAGKNAGGETAQNPTEIQSDVQRVLVDWELDRGMTINRTRPARREKRRPNPFPNASQ